ncbi:MAG: PAS domain S-box protein, partial [Cyclobacteriaceae bacterium]|nr:PAS domain S-box protein [Cyclobacteriaceae bacterium]
MPLLPTMQHIIDNLPVVVFEYTIFPDGSRDFTYLSKGCKEILGIDRELLLQGTYPLQSFIYRDDWENFNLLFEKAASEVVPFKWEGRIFSFGAEIKWIEVSGVPVRLEGGRIGWSGVISDIRQRKELEQQQTESDRRYRTLVESLPLGMGVHQQGKLVYVNEYAAKMMGAENTDQMIGMSVLDFVHPDNKQQVIERTRKVMAGEFLDFAEEKFITLDGRELIVETQAQPFIFNGKPAVQIIVKNITEQKLANETIRKTETLFSELFNSAPMAIVLLKSDGNVERVNHGFETMFGYSISELKGKSLNNFIVPRNLESEGNYVNSMISENRFVRLETYRLRKDG